MAKRKAKRTTKALSELPKGYTAIGGFGKSWPDDDTKPGESIAGIVTEYQEDIKTQHGITSNLKLETASGEVFTVWRSAALAVLFDDDDYTDMEVWLRFDGLGKKKGKKNPAKLFTIAVKE